MTNGRQRIHSIDFLRGLVIALMTVDHVREFFFFTVPLPDPMDLSRIDAATFFTRWLAHFCAPVFVLLTGVSAYLHAQRRSLARPELSLFLLKRGLLLIVLEVTLINFAWTFSFPPQKIFLQVIWAIGLSMICLAVLIWLPRCLLLAVAVLIIGGHNLFDGLIVTEGTPGYWLWAVFHQRSLLPLGDLMVRTSYPVLPWIGIMALGYGCGHWFAGEVAAEDRERYLRLAGMGMIAGFITLRLWGGYGEPNPWAIHEGQPLMTLMSFLNLTKYPPSLLFVLMTLGPSLLLLRAVENWRGRGHDALVTFGRVPFFYYVLHLYALHLAYRASGLALGYRWDGTPAVSGLAAKLDVGSISAVWAISLLTLLLLYPLVIRLARLKAEKRSPLLSYF